MIFFLYFYFDVSLFHISWYIIVALLLFSSDHMLLISLHDGKFCMLFCHLLKFFKFSFSKILSGILHVSEHQTVWNQAPRL